MRVPPFTFWSRDLPYIATEGGLFRPKLQQEADIVYILLDNTRLLLNQMYMQQNTTSLLDYFYALSKVLLWFWNDISQQGYIIQYQF